MDDIFLIYDSTRTTPENILQYINSIHSCIQLNPNLESNKSVNFLDLTITRNKTHIEIGIYRETATTDTTINYLSNHPLEHTMAAHNFLISRMLNFPLNSEQQHSELVQIVHI